MSIEKGAIDWELEAGEQMAAKLEAQMALKCLVAALDLKFDELPAGWSAAVKVMLARIETIVDEADRAFRERDEVREALHRCRGDMHAKVIALQKQLADERRSHV